MAETDLIAATRTKLHGMLAPVRGGAGGDVRDDVRFDAVAAELAKTERPSFFDELYWGSLHRVERAVADPPA